MERPFVMRELLERGEFQGWESRRKPEGAAIALSIQQDDQSPTTEQTGTSHGGNSKKPTERNPEARKKKGSPEKEV